MRLLSICRAKFVGDVVDSVLFDFIGFDGFNFVFFPLGGKVMELVMACDNGADLTLPVCEIVSA